MGGLWETETVYMDLQGKGKAKKSPTVTDKKKGCQCDRNESLIGVNTMLPMLAGKSLKN